jgi:hypothetical protein
MENPVEGGPSMDNAWFQGWATALGYTASTRLTLALGSASATIDRKTAYAVASFSLYIAVVSLVATSVFAVG